MLQNSLPSPVTLCHTPFKPPFLRDIFSTVPKIRLRSALRPEPRRLSLQRPADLLVLTTEAESVKSLNGHGMCR